MDDVNSLVKSVQTAMTEIDKPTPAKRRSRRNSPEDKEKIVSLPKKEPRRERARDPINLQKYLEQLNTQPKQPKTVRFPVELCEQLTKAKHWQCLEGKTPDTEQGILMEAVAEWLAHRGRLQIKP